MTGSVENSARSGITTCTLSYIDHRRQVIAWGGQLAVQAAASKPSALFSDCGLRKGGKSGGDTMPPILDRQFTPADALPTFLII